MEHFAFSCHDMLNRWQRSMTIAIAHKIKCTTKVTFAACIAITLKLDGFVYEHSLLKSEHFDFTINDVIAEEKRIMKALNFDLYSITSVYNLIHECAYWDTVGERDKAVHVGMMLDHVDIPLYVADAVISTCLNSPKTTSIDVIYGCAKKLLDSNHLTEINKRKI